MLKLNLQYFGHLIGRADSLEKDPDAGKDWRQAQKRTTEDDMVGRYHQLSRHEFEQAPLRKLSSGHRTGKVVKDREAWRAASIGLQRAGHDWVAEKPQNFYLVVTLCQSWLDWGIKSCVWWERQIGSMISDIMGCLGVIVQGRIYRWMHGKERLTKNEEARCFYPIKLPSVCLTFPFVCI